MVFGWIIKYTFDFNKTLKGNCEKKMFIKPFISIFFKFFFIIGRIILKLNYKLAFLKKKKKHTHEDNITTKSE